MSEFINNAAIGRIFGDADPSVRAYIAEMSRDINAALDAAIEYGIVLPGPISRRAYAQGLDLTRAHTPSEYGPLPTHDLEAWERRMAIAGEDLVVSWSTYPDPNRDGKAILVLTLFTGAPRRDRPDDEMWVTEIIGGRHPWHSEQQWSTSRRQAIAAHDRVLNRVRELDLAAKSMLTEVSTLVAKLTP